VTLVDCSDDAPVKAIFTLSECCNVAICYTAKTAQNSRFTEKTHQTINATTTQYKFNLPSAFAIDTFL